MNSRIKRRNKAYKRDVNGIAIGVGNFHNESIDDVSKFGKLPTKEENRNAKDERYVMLVKQFNRICSCRNNGSCHGIIKKVIARMKYLSKQNV